MQFDKVYTRHFYNRKVNAETTDGLHVIVNKKDKTCQKIKKNGITVVVGLVGGRAYGAVAVCSRSDQFSRKEGRRQALEYLEDIVASPLLSLNENTKGNIDVQKFYSEARNLTFEAIEHLPFKQTWVNGDGSVPKGFAYVILNDVLFICAV